MFNKSLRRMTQTAMMLAVTLLMQYMAGLMPIPAGPLRTLLIGSLVNLCLFVTAWMVSWQGGVLVGILTPLVALWIGQLPVPHMFPIVALANAAMVTVCVLVGRRHRYAGVAAAAVVKTVILWVLVVWVFVPFLLPSIGLPEAKVSAMTTMLSVNFTWPQLVAACVGGIVSVPVMKPLERFCV